MDGGGIATTGPAVLGAAALAAKHNLKLGELK